MNKLITTVLLKILLVIITILYLAINRVLTSFLKPIILTIVDYIYHFKVYVVYTVPTTKIKDVLKRHITIDDAKVNQIIKNLKPITRRRRFELGYVEHKSAGPNIEKVLTEIVSCKYSEHFEIIYISEPF